MNQARKVDSDMEYFFNPKSVAVVGASEKPGKWGHEVLKGIVEGGYEGHVYPINAKGGDILGLRVYASVQDVDEPIDLALIIIPSTLVLKAIESCSRKGVKAAVVISAGFAETGEEGSKLQEDIVKAAGRMRVIGPNCMGIVNLEDNLNATFWHYLRGSFALLTQGGTLALEAETIARKKGLGFTKIVHLGNQADVGFCELLEYIQDDPATKVILMYIEGLRQNEGKQLLHIAQKLTGNKPIVAFKAARTKAGARGASSHTASVAGNDRIYDAAFEQAGIIRAGNSQELVDIAEALLKCPPMTGNRIAVLSDGGSHVVMVCDAAERYGLELSTFSDITRERLERLLLPQSIKWNPVDFAGAADTNLGVIPKAAEIVLQDRNVDGLLMVGVAFGAYSKIFGVTGEEEVAAELAKVQQKYGKAVILGDFVSMENAPSLQTLMHERIPVYTSVEMTARCMAALTKYGMYLEKLKSRD